MRLKLKFKLTYFDETGKFAMFDEHEYNALTDARKLPIMQYVKSHIRGLRDCVGQYDPLPGGWTGIILIEYRGCKPALLLPGVE